MGRVHGKFRINKLPEFIGNSLLRLHKAPGRLHKGPLKAYFGDDSMGYFGGFRPYFLYLGGAQSALDPFRGGGDYLGTIKLLEAL